PPPPLPTPPHLPYPTLFRSVSQHANADAATTAGLFVQPDEGLEATIAFGQRVGQPAVAVQAEALVEHTAGEAQVTAHNAAIGHIDRKSTRLNSSHEWISYAV